MGGGGGGGGGGWGDNALETKAERKKKKKRNGYKIHESRITRNKKQKTNKQKLLYRRSNDKKEATTFHYTRQVLWTTRAAAKNMQSCVTEKPVCSACGKVYPALTAADQHFCFDPATQRTEVDEQKINSEVSKT